MNMQKWKTMKAEVNADWKNEGGFKVRLYKFFILSLRWFLTIVVTYSMTVTTVAYMIPFTAAYLAGSAQIAGTTDLVSSITLWLFPALAATIILTVLCLVMDYGVYRFFKKHIRFDTSKNVQTETVSQTMNTDKKITDIKMMKPLKNRL